MTKRFGKKRVPGCRCEFSFTCGPCLRAAGPTESIATEERTSAYGLSCPQCGSLDVPELGQLGELTHYRCRACGWTFAK